MYTEFEASNQQHDSNSKEHNQNLTALPNAEILFKCKN